MLPCRWWQHGTVAVRCWPPLACSAFSADRASQVYGCVSGGGEGCVRECVGGLCGGVHVCVCMCVVSWSARLVCVSVCSRRCGCVQYSDLQSLIQGSVY